MFKTILSEQWTSLSPSLQQHYGLEEGDEIVLQGELSVKHGKFMKLLMPFIRLSGALVPVEGDKFHVTVKNKREGGDYYWSRQFRKDNKTYVFNSVMNQAGDDVIENVGLGLGIKMGLSQNNGGLLYVDKGYVVKLGKHYIPVPLHLLMGRSVIEEFTQNGNNHDIDMKFVVNHPWFGFMFSYMGCFNIERYSKGKEGL